MKTLLKTVETLIADIELQYQEECSRDYGSHHSSYLLGVLGGLYKVRIEINKQLEEIELEETIVKLDETLTKMENELKGT